MVRCPERRSLERFPVTNMKATISVRYRFGTHHGDVVDFNRFGTTVVMRRPLPIRRLLFVSLKYPGSRLDEIVGAAHHCRYSQTERFAAESVFERTRRFSSTATKSNICSKRLNGKLRSRSARLLHEARALLPRAQPGDETQSSIS